MVCPPQPTRIDGKPRRVEPASGAASTTGGVPGQDGRTDADREAQGLREGVSSAASSEEAAAAARNEAQLEAWIWASRSIPRKEADDE